MRADWLKIVFVYFDGDTKLARADDVSKENLHFDNQS